MTVLSRITCTLGAFCLFTLGCVESHAASNSFENIDLAQMRSTEARLGQGVLWQGSPLSNAASDYLFDYVPPTNARPNVLGLVIENESTGRPIATLPLPLGNGLAIGLTGTLEFQAFGRTYRWTNTDPHSAGTTTMLPNTEIGAALTLGSAVSIPKRSKPPYRLSLSHPSGLRAENLRVSLVCTSRPCRITGTTFTYPPLKLSVSSGLRGERTTEHPSSLYLTRGGTARISSSCTIEADPNTIHFGNIKAHKKAGALDLSRSSTISIACQNGSNAPVAISLDIPWLYSDSNQKFAAFRHDNGDKFKGLGLVYAFDQDKLGCSGTTLDWRKRQSIGRLQDGQATQIIYWGLCQLENRTDSGRFSTTATVRFWVN